MSQLTKDQQTIFDSLVNRIRTYPGRTEAVVVGPAGTGKTRLVSEIVKSLHKGGYNLAITTPTHKANAVIKNMIYQTGIRQDEIEVSTIHRFLGLKLVYEKNRQVLKLDPFNKQKFHVDVLIVDECSMISEDMYTYIMNQIHRVRRAIIFIGDSCQLPPVESEGTKDETKLSPTFNISLKYELTEVLRQALDNPIIKLATDIRKCIGTNKDPMKYLRQIHGYDTVTTIEDEMLSLNVYRDYIKDYAHDSTELYDEVQENKIIAYTNYRVNFSNMYIRNELFPDYAEIEFIKDEPIVFESITENCPYTVQEIIKCPDLRPESFMGIDCWQMTSINGNAILCVGPYSRIKLETHLDELVRNIENKNINPFSKRPYTWQDYYIIKNKINVINYPYATTAHKSQGSTFDNIWFDTDFIDRIGNNDTKCRIIYTALTRPRYQIMLKNY